ncbi:unnamed protein product [Dovyalis caffra]|uniref:Uncharacterized protein n=1 Tax=Dovyalis caffra TaxID=77055 RepID=A0AAV1QYQ9_9ROSI|nr:unnamed protein product [Dovyalis caffra]
MLMETTINKKDETILTLKFDSLHNPSHPNDENLHRCHRCLILPPPTTTSPTLSPQPQTSNHNSCRIKSNQTDEEQERKGRQKRTE